MTRHDTSSRAANQCWSTVSEQFGWPTKFRRQRENGFFLIVSIYTAIYYEAMNTTAPTKLLEQIALIQRMEPGKLCVMRQGPDGPYYNLQCREHGKTISRYVPRDQVEAVAEHTANHQAFRTLVETYAQEIIDRTRSERLEASKKKTSPDRSSWRRAKKSKR